MTSESLKTYDLSKIRNDGNFKIGYRNSFLDTPILIGREREIILPNREKHKSYFALVSLDNIIASHNEKSFGSTDSYPKTETNRNINDRDYTKPFNKAMVVKIAQQLEPNLLISTSAGADGTPIISLDGVVVSGNNRVMSLKLAYSEFNDSRIAYKETLLKELREGGYGFVSETASKLQSGKIRTQTKTRQKSEVVKSISNPVLVRIDVDFQSYLTEEMNQYNVDTKKSETQIGQAIRIAQQLEDNTECKDRLIQLVSEQETVSELYNRKSDVDRLKKILLSCKLISEYEIAKYFIGNTLSESGKTFYNVLLSSLILSPNTLEISQNNGVKSATKRVVNAIIPAIQNRSFEKGSLMDEINKALIIQNRMINSKIDDIIMFVNQPELFEDDFKLDFKPAVINYYLNQNQNDFKKILLSYNSSMNQNQTKDIFGESLTSDEIFSKTFVETLPKNVTTALEKRFLPDIKPVIDLEAIKKRIKVLKMSYRLTSSPETKKIITQLEKSL